MRADRLIAALLVLQTRGRVTAGELAVELEVSERTARRDLEALAMSGVPVYSQHGRGGGWELVGGARTDLSGLSADEAQALFLAAGPSLESTPALKSAMRKLTSALPETFRESAAAASGAVKIDAQGWGRVGSTNALASDEPLTLLTNAVVAGRQVTLFYDSASTDPGMRTASPLGLVTKRNVWYLVANTDRGTRTYRVSRISNVSLLETPVDRPDGFDLDVAWDTIVTEVESRRGGLWVQAWVDDSAMTAIQWVFNSLRVLETDAANQRVKVEIGEQSEFALAGQLAGFGGRVRLIDPPPELIAELARIAAELGSLYPLEDAGAIEPS